MRESVGIIRIEEAITDSEKIVKRIKRLREHSMVKAVVVRVETPGGGVAASEEIYREVLKIRTENEKPVIVSMGSVAASGGYYIAAAADHIYATSGTVTGSIGVIAPNFNAVETLQKLGLKQSTIATGEHKNAGNPFNEQSESERTLLQGVINDMYRQFFRVVLESRHEPILAASKTAAFNEVLNPIGTKAEGRGIEWSTFTTGTIAQHLQVPVESETALRRLADGRIFTGEQALKVGLVDSIGTLQDAIDHAGRLCGLGDDPKTVEVKKKSYLSTLLGTSARNFLREVSASQTTFEYRGWF